MLEDIHRLASIYHWSEEAILRLPLDRRAAYLSLIEADRDSRLFAALNTVG